MKRAATNAAPFGLRPRARGAVALLLLALCAACAQQDPALLVTMTGMYRVPADADHLLLDVLEGAVVIKHKEWCATTTSTCPDALPPMPTLSASVTLVQSGAEHPQVKINVSLKKGTAVVGLGTQPGVFQPGRTVDVAIPVTSP